MLKELLEKHHKEKDEQSKSRLGYVEKLKQELTEAQIQFTIEPDNRSRNDILTIRMPGGFTNLKIYIEAMRFNFNNNAYAFSGPHFNDLMQDLVCQLTKELI